MSISAESSTTAPCSRLRLSGLMASDHDPACDRLAQLAATVMRTKIALISLIDRDLLLLKSCTGLSGVSHAGRERPLARSLSRFVVETGAPVSIPDVRDDARTKGDPTLAEFQALACLGAPLLAEDNQVIGTLWVMSDIPRAWTTEEVTILQGLATSVVSEVQLREEVQSHQRAERRLRLHLEVTEVLASQLNLSDGIARILEVIAQEMGFTAGELWRVSETDGRLHCAGFWRSAGAPLGDFEKGTREVSFARGESLIGRVWKAARPMWVTDLRKENDFKRADLAKAAGLHSSFAFPVCTPEADGVMCFFGPKSWEPDPALQLSLAGLGQQIGAFVQHRWKTDAVATELGRSEQRFRQLCDLAPVGIFQTDANGRCTFVNAQWRRYTGLSLEQAMGDGWVKGLHPEFTYVYERWRKVAPSGVQFSTEFRFKAKDGTTAWVLGQTVPLRNERGEVTGHIGVLRDISSYKRSEESMRQQKAAAEQANEAKSRFLANMSHEVRTPLNGILGLSNMLLDSKLDPEQRKIADLVLGSAQSLLAIVNDILDFSKVESGHVELEQIDYDLTELIDAVVQLNQSYAAEKNLEIVTQLSPNLPRRLHGDPARLQQVLNNLVSNATKFSQDGRVVIGVELTNSEADGSLLRFSVRDEGPGIPEEAQSRIFDAFAQADASTTRRYGGTGLGLAICQQLVELMGGTIDVESKLGNGSTFSFSAPYQPRHELPPPEGASELERESDPSLLSLRVLLAEDNRINRIVATNQLQKLGCTVDTVEDGQAAVDAALDTPYDLIFMDCHMPVLDGYSATREIRSRWSQDEPARIIALTANAMQGERERCLACGMDEYLSKPVALAELRRAMISVLPPETIKRAAQIPEVVSADRLAVIESLHAMEADGVDVTLVLELFHEEAAQAVARVEAALEAGNADELWRAAHKLKGTAAELGAEALREYWGELEQCGRTGDLTRSAELFKGAKAELEQVRSVLESAPFGAGQLPA